MKYTSIIISLFFALLQLNAQFFTSPFPDTAPVVGYSLETAFPGLTFSYPNSVVTMRVRTNAFGDPLLYVQGRYGQLTFVNLNNPTNKVVALDNVANTFYVADSGFLCMAFHPTKPYLFTFGTETNKLAGNMSDKLIRWQIDTNTDKIIASSKTVLIDQVDTSQEHTGGALAFGPDGYLYVSLGDEGGQNGVLRNTQIITNKFFSAVMRIDVDELPTNLLPNPSSATIAHYRIPNDNPYIGITSFNGYPVDPFTVRTEFWAVGFRNPHRMSFDTNGDLWLGDVGNVRWEEVNKVIKGGNYGWNGYEGNEITTFKEAISNHNILNYVGPVWTYPHSAIAIGYDPRFIGNCIIGGFVYHGNKYPYLKGKYLCADYISKNIWAISLTPQFKVERIAVSEASPSEIYLNPVTGDILIGCLSPGTISKLVPANVTIGVPNTLADTGLFDNVSTLEFKSGILPYDVANTFWSDNAIKSRWFFLPANTSITRTSENYIFPPGSVFIKNFKYNLIQNDPNSQFNLETRFIVVTTNGAYGLTYRWDSDQLNATLVPDQGLDITINVDRSGIIDPTPWHFPARSECSTCHNSTPNFVLGFSDRQLNTTITNELGQIVNQLIDLSALGVFSNPVYSTNGIPSLSKADDTSYSLEHRFKSYTDANCAYCHQPNGPGRGDWDARFSVPINMSSIINGSVIDDLGITNAKVVVAGNTNLSIMFHRIADFYSLHQPEEYHMPPLGTHEVNHSGVKLLHDYIISIAPRTNWLIGIINNSHDEFPQENRINDLSPGSWFGLDDDFYTSGTYPSGFNNLASSIHIEQDEPSSNWERALTNGDRTNRLHFVVSETKNATLKIGFRKGGWMINGVVQSSTMPPTGNLHDIVLIHKTLTNSTIIWQGGINANTTLTIPLIVDSGPNTIEFIRTGPIVTGNSYWVMFDYVSLNTN
ncbi:MAG: hypothetical protein EKK57_10230 [Proteobacteria bacterium]|nr:MAG: hypothetical protein EKK57_10230 [Pseudomonadota bacterium]